MKHHGSQEMGNISDEATHPAQRPTITNITCVGEEEFSSEEENVRTLELR